MKLFLAHCGFYPAEMQEGLFECHTNFFVVASTARDARSKVLGMEKFRSHRMHLDSLLELATVEGFRIALRPLRATDVEEPNKTFGFRELRAMAESPTN